jgi:glycosyltransferase involved in cell wall biosynthesis
MTRPVVVMAGPLPPTVGGMASVLGALAGSSLAERVDLRLFETGKTTPPGRPLWQGVAARLSLMARWWRLFGAQPRPVAHVHTCSGLTYFLDGGLLLLSRMRGARVILHIHGAKFDHFLDGLSAPMAALARWLAARASVIVVLSPEWQERLDRRWPGLPTEVVANGVSMPCRASLVAAAPGPARFAFLGNLGRRKGVHVLLDAAEQASQPWEVDLAGGVEEPGFDRWVAEEVERRGLTDRVHLLGPVVGDAKVDLLASAQGFVLPSLAEGLPMAMLEAMAMSLPVVVSDAGAMPEAVRDGIDGLVVPAGDAAALAAALDRLAARPAEREEMGRSAAERCASRYGIGRMADALMVLYEVPPPGPRIGAVA